MITYIAAACITESATSCLTQLKNFYTNFSLLQEKSNRKGKTIYTFYRFKYLKKFIEEVILPTFDNTVVRRLVFKFPHNLFLFFLVSGLKSVIVSYLKNTIPL